jgi:hypothetical protein
MLIIGGVVAATMFAQKEVADRTQQAVNAASVSAEQRMAPVKLAPMTLEPGKELEITLPSSDGDHQGRVVATLNVSLQEETPFEITMSSSSVITRCKIKALDAQSKALARAPEEDDHAQIYPVLPQGSSTIIVDCDSHPAERSVRVLARALPLVLPGQSVQIVIEPGSESAGAGVIPDQPGLYVIALEGKDSSTSLQVLGADDVLVGKQDINSSTDRALVEASLQVEGYLVQALRSSSAGQKMPFTVTLTRVEPERILLGTETTGTLARQVERRIYLLRLDAATKVAVTLRSSAFDHAVELQRADGVAIATSDEERAGQTARVAPNVPLEVGEYRIVVRGEEYDASAGDYTLKVEAVVDAPATPTKRGGRRGNR